LTSIESHSKDLPCPDVLEIVTKELQQQIDVVKKATQGSHKTAKVSFISCFLACY